MLQIIRNKNCSETLSFKGVCFGKIMRDACKFESTRLNLGTYFPGLVLGIEFKCGHGKIIIRK